MRQDPFYVDEPVNVVDQIHVRPGEQGAVIRLFKSAYMTSAEERGLRMIAVHAFPPFDNGSRESHVLLEWEYASLPVLWAARGPEETDKHIADFWKSLEPLIVARTRRLGRSNPMPLPAVDASIDPVEKHPRAITFFKPPFDHKAIEQLNEVGLRGGINAGGYTFLPEGLTVESSPLRLFGPFIDSVEIAPIAGGLREPGLSSGVKRTILLRAIDGVADTQIARLEDELANMALNLNEIRNWVVSKVTRSDGEVAWTHCIEQEFCDVGDVTGAYLNHPYHWAVVDRLFHPEAPERVCDTFFQTIYPIKRSVLA